MKTLSYNRKTTFLIDHDSWKGMTDIEKIRSIGELTEEGTVTRAYLAQFLYRVADTLHREQRLKDAYKSTINFMLSLIAGLLICLALAWVL